MDVEGDSCMREFPITAFVFLLLGGGGTHVSLFSRFGLDA